MNNPHSSENHFIYGPSDHSSPVKPVISNQNKQDRIRQEEKTCKVVPLYPYSLEHNEDSSFEVVSIFKSGKSPADTSKTWHYAHVISWALILGGIICLTAGFIIKDTISELYKASSIVLMLLGIYCSQFSEKP